MDDTTVRNQVVNNASKKESKVALTKKLVKAVELAWVLKYPADALDKAAANV